MCVCVCVCVGLSTIESWNCRLQQLRVVNDTWCTLTITCLVVHHREQQTRKAATIESIGHCSSSSEERDRHSPVIHRGDYSITRDQTSHCDPYDLNFPSSPSLHLSFVDFFNPPPPTGSINQSLLEPRLSLECCVSFDFTIDFRRGIVDVIGIK